MKDQKKSLADPIQIGSVSLQNRVFFAPLAGCSDLPYRQVASEWQAGLTFCEMVKMDALVRHDPNTYRLLDYTTNMHPIGAQLCGSKPSLARQCARIVEDLGFDILDLNCGCPVDKVTKDGSGSGLLKTPEKIGEIISELRAGTKIPVTIKIRIGWDEENINATEVVRIAKQAGASAVTIHGRTRAQGYKGSARWDSIRECREGVKQIQIIGNGDVFDAQSAVRLFEITGCDAILVARGAMGQPWIVEDILRLVNGLDPIERGVGMIRMALLNHFHKIVAYQTERQALLDMRRVGCWYLRRLNGVRALRSAINKSLSTKETFQAIEAFFWEEAEIMKDLAPIGGEV